MVGDRILIVEDEILVAREIESHLSEMEYEVVGIAIDPATVLQQIAETTPDLILMDINLHGEQHGITIAQEVRDRFQIPIIYITAYADSDTLERAKLTHPCGYVLKPFNERDLRVAIELALFRHQTSIDPQPENIKIKAFSNPETPPTGLPPHKLQKVLDYIDANLSQELSLERLANQVGLTPYYFARLFKQSIGKSVHQYVIHRRVERAKQLLKQSELTIADVAVECGFANPSHLALHFKRIVGVSPKQFRFFEGCQG